MRRAKSLASIVGQHKRSEQVRLWYEYEVLESFELAQRKQAVPVLVPKTNKSEPKARTVTNTPVQYWQIIE
jgi:hypothetical protein